MMTQQEFNAIEINDEAWNAFIFDVTLRLALEGRKGKPRGSRILRMMRFWVWVLCLLTVGEKKTITQLPQGTVSISKCLPK